ncbi:MAG: LruC domain-containing protein, partial [Pedobacter sp.]
TNINIGAINFANNLTVIVTANSVVKFGSSFNWGSAATFKNFGTVEEINTSPSLTGGVFRNQGTMKIKGSLTISADANPTKVYNTGSLEVTASSNFRGLFENSGTVLLNGSQNFLAGSDFRNEAGGSVTIQGSNYSDLGGKFDNAGTFTIDGAGLNMNNSSAPTTFVNSGTFSGTSAKLVLSGTFTNNGTVTVNEIAVNSGGKIYNNCKWFVTKTDQWINTIDGLIENTSYFSVSGGIQVNSNGTIRLKNGALFATKYVSTLNTPVEAPLNGSTSVFKINDSYVNGSTVSNVKFNGPIQVVSTAALPAAMFANGAQRKATSAETVTISAGSCMAEGSGPVVNTDPDGDTVHGTADLYPNDPNKAYNSFSENYFNEGSTIAFEDNWPSQGDYDLNDLGIRYQHKVITNAQNKVVRIEA